MCYIANANKRRSSSVQHAENLWPIPKDCSHPPSGATAGIGVDYFLPALLFLTICTVQSSAFPNRGTLSHTLRGHLKADLVTLLE